MARKPKAGRKRARLNGSEEAEDTRPKGPAAVGVLRQQGTRTFRKQRSS